MVIIDVCFTRFVDRSQIIKAHASLWVKITNWVLSRSRKLSGGGGIYNTSGESISLCAAKCLTDELHYDDHDDDSCKFLYH